MNVFVLTKTISMHKCNLCLHHSFLIVLTEQNSLYEFFHFQFCSLCCEFRKFPFLHSFLQYILMRRFFFFSVQVLNTRYLVTNS